MSDDDELNLSIMSRALGRVAEYLQGVGLDAFLDDQMRVDAVAINLLTIGEHAGRLSQEMKASVPVPWVQIVNLRHQLAHAYAGIDAEQLWTIAAHDAPVLRAQVAAWLETR